MLGTYLFRIGSFGVPAMGACVLVGAILAVDAYPVSSVHALPPGASDVLEAALQSLPSYLTTEHTEYSVPDE